MSAKESGAWLHALPISNLGLMTSRPEGEGFITMRCWTRLEARGKNALHGLGCAWQQLKPKRQKEQAALQESTKWKRNLSQQDLGKWSLTQPNLLQSFDVLYVLNNILSSASQGDIIQVHHTKLGPELTTVMMQRIIIIIIWLAHPRMAAELPR